MSISSIKAFFVCCCIIFSSNTPAQTTEHIAEVVKVIDGDTFDVKDKDSTYRIRLFGIDAPERGQEFFKESKELLEGLTKNTKIILDARGKDRYGRTLAIITRLNDQLNVNYQMVRMGLAWHYVRFTADPELAKLELFAREKQIGIWSLYHFLEPWEYRKH